mgnify:CR=1 FL=1
MSKAILRFEKLKSLSAVSSFERHGKDRSRLANRSHPEREEFNREYIPRIYENKTMVERWRECVGDATIRSNAVYAIEAVLAFSPEQESFIRQNRESWIKANAKWLSSAFNGSRNVISLRVDEDEKTLHAHALIVPMYDGKLNCKHFLNGKRCLIELQTSYANAMKEFGLERGTCWMDHPEELTRRHEHQKKYWYEKEREDIKWVKENYGDSFTFDR